MKTLTAMVLGNPVWAWIVAAGAVILWLGIVALAKLWVRKRRSRDRQPDRFATRAALALAQSTSVLLACGLILWAVTFVLALPDRVERVLRTVSILSLSTQGALWISSLIALAAARTEERSRDRDPGSATTIHALGLAGKAAVWIVVVLLWLHNAGIDITALVAGLGIGGVAVALALQNILGDVFSSIAIILDKPYQVGDFIVVGDSMGIVTRIGVKTTRLRSLSGEQLIFSNGELLKSRIRNFSRMTERRVEFAIGVSYQTPHEKVERVPEMLRKIIGSHEHVRLERAHFKEFGETSLTFECVYFVTDFGYSLFLEIQEAINLEILRRFQEEEIEFAQPGRSLYVAQGVAQVRW